MSICHTESLAGRFILKEILVISPVKMSPTVQYVSGPGAAASQREWETTPRLVYIHD